MHRVNTLSIFTIFYLLLVSSAAFGDIPAEIGQYTLGNVVNDPGQCASCVAHEGLLGDIGKADQVTLLGNLGLEMFELAQPIDVFSYKGRVESAFIVIRAPTGEVENKLIQKFGYGVKTKIRRSGECQISSSTVWLAGPVRLVLEPQEGPKESVMMLEYATLSDAKQKEKPSGPDQTCNP